ncbi:MAG: hypothetical protein K940chlam6_00425 [Chlamydiae bacterium]|nr:hypothetical protein [Chlamydiota bacterium]
MSLAEPLYIAYPISHGPGRGHGGGWNPAEMPFQPMDACARQNRSVRKGISALHGPFRVGSDLAKRMSAQDTKCWTRQLKFAAQKNL